MEENKELTLEEDELVSGLKESGLWFDDDLSDLNELFRALWHHNFMLCLSNMTVLVRLSWYRILPMP